MEQQSLIIENIYEALTDCCKAIGGGKGWAKKAGHMIWPQKSPDDASKLLHNCLDHTRPEKLDPEQVIWILREARQVGCHIAMYYIADECHYQRPQPIEPEDEQAELQREFIQSVKKQQGLLVRLEKLDTLFPRK